MGRNSSPSAAELRTIRARMRDPDFRSRARLSAGPDHINAKYWLITAPGGREYQARNLMLWCQTNADLWSAKWRSVYNQFCANRCYRGWTAKPWGER